MTRAAPLALALLSLTGCASFSTMSTARTLRRGGAQVYVAPHVLGTGIRAPPPPPDEHAGEHGAATSSGPSGSIDLDMEVGVRYGATDAISVGGRLWALGGAVQGQLQLRRSAAPDAGVDVGLGVEASYAGSRGDGTLLLLQAPLLFGFNTGGGNQVVAAPKLVGAYLVRPQNSAGILLAGGSLGYSYQVADGFSLLPEVSMLVPVATPADRFTYYGLVIQAALGFVFSR
jgi:hypothetical protein